MKYCVEIGDPIVAELKIDEFVVPCLEWSNDLEPLRVRTLKSFKAMFTLLQNTGAYDTILKKYAPNISDSNKINHEYMFALEQNIVKQINMVANSILDNKEPKNILDQVREIAIAIHLWGGNTGRNSFVKDGGFDKNFSPVSYLEIIKCVIVGDIEKAILIWGNGTFNHIGISFASKHVSYWSKADRAVKKYPVFDSLMAEVTLGRNGLLNWRHYRKYLEGMEATVKIVNITGFTVIHLERQIYNWINQTTPAIDWINQRIVE